MQFCDDLVSAQSLDAGNIHSARDQFIIPRHGEDEAIYFLGNSLGLQPKAAAARMQEVLDTWSALGVEGFFKGDTPWLQYHEQLAKPLSAVVGAFPEEVVVMNSLTVNLHLMLVSFYAPLGKRRKILCEAKAFPSDQYMLETHIRQRGLDPDEVLIEVGPREGTATIDEQDILEAIEEHKDTLALVFWGGVNYYTGQLFDMQAITRAGKAAGAKVGFDLAHAAGNVALQLHDWDVDFACWCSYKYLNSGPGAVGAAFIHQRYHNDQSLHRFAGWWGYKKETRFQMQQGFIPVASAEGWGLSTPSPLLFAAHLAALQLFEKTTIQALAEQGRTMSSYLIFLMGAINKQLPHPLIKVITPAGETERGCQVSLLMLQNGKGIFDELAANGVFADWREPDVIRVAPVPLYNRFEEIWKFKNILLAACKKFTTHDPSTTNGTDLQQENLPLRRT
ncbi:MAG TPA: kynureninase [Flavisolibacter sp.]